MNKEAKGEIPLKAMIIQKLIYPPDHLNYSSTHYKITILSYSEIEE